MKVIINNQVFDPDETPIILYLTDEDKDNITRMDPEAHVFAVYPDGMDEYLIEKQCAQICDRYNPKETKHFPPLPPTETIADNLDIDEVRKRFGN
ncbi:MAG: hypothetical protein ACXAEN_25465 [Candidatus Thorarchaeota archaeon]|jgi:hypothetical protein